MTLSVVTSRTTWLVESAMNRSPAASTATSDGLDSEAEVAWPPSPPYPYEPPATVWMTPSGVTSRTAAPVISSMNTSPDASTDRPTGRPTAAEVAGPPSPLSSLTPSPAKVWITPSGVTL